MPKCAAAGCTAGYKKGDLFKVFPRKDWKRRQIWIERVNRPGWLPNKYSSLCERHFDHEQWEIPREDGKRKLKSTAVPTIFCVGHPSKNDVVAKDHSYCILGYRQLYDISDSSDKYGSNKNGNDCTTLFEHIKVEVNDTELFATESLEEENNELFSPENIETENDKEVGNDEAENIQCTPDISFYPEPNEPDPIEMVHCEENETNTNMAEPSFDPLAISAEDRKYAQTEVPHFYHAKKFVFVQKDKRIVVSTASTEVTGEPAASLPKPMIKILSPQQLLGLPSDSHLPDSNAQSVTSDQKGLPKLQVAFIKHASKSPETEVDPQQLPRLARHPFPKKIKTNCVSGHSKIFKHPRVVQKILIPKPPPLTPSPTFLQNSKTVRISPNYSRKFIKICSNSKQMNRQSSPKFLFPKKNLHINARYESGFLKEFGADVSKPKPNPISNSLDVCERLEKVYLDHEYLDETPWRPVSMDGMKIVEESSSKKSNKSVYRFIGNNDVKMWLTKNCPPAGSSTDACLKTTKFKVTEPSNCTGAKKVDGVCISGSSVVVLNPFEKSKSGTSSQIKLISSVNNQNINLFLCAICKCSFLTMPSLKLHLNSHTKEKTNQEKTSFTNKNDPITKDKDIQEEDKKHGVDRPDCNVKNNIIQEEEKIMTLGKDRQDVVTSTNGLEQKTFVKNNNDGLNKNDDVKTIEANCIQKNVDLKRLVISIPKLNVNPEIKPAIQSKRVTKYPAKSSTVSNKNVLKTYGLRRKTKLMQTKLIISKYKEKNKRTTVLKKKEKNKLTTVHKNKEKNKLTTVHKNKEKNKLTTVRKNKEKNKLITVHKYKEKNKLTTVHKYNENNKLTTVLKFKEAKVNNKSQSTASSKPNSKKTKRQSTASSKANSKKTKSQSTASSKPKSKKTKGQSTTSSKANSKKTKSQSTASSKPNSKKTETISVSKRQSPAPSKPNSRKTETVSVSKSQSSASSKPNSKKTETVSVSQSQSTASSKPNSKKTEKRISTKDMSLIKKHSKRGKVDGKSKPISTTTKNINESTGKDNTTSTGNNKLQETTPFKGKITKTNDVKHKRNSLFSASKPSHPSSAKYACEYCDKRFYKKFLLQRHSAKEHEKEEKPHKCEWKLCDMKFLSKRQSNNHSKICSKRPS